MEKSRVITALLKVLEEGSDLRVMQYAVDALGRFGAEAGRARPLLKALAIEGDDSIKKNALLALERIGPGESRLSIFSREHPLIVKVATILASYFLAVSLFTFGILWRRPFWVLRMNKSIRSFTWELPGWLGKSKVSLRFVLGIGFVNYHRRVLDAWVEQHLQGVIDTFESRESVKHRAIHVDLATQLQETILARLTPQALGGVFDTRCCLLIWGDGGSGKTSLACQIGKWASQDDLGLCKHAMLPVLLEPGSLIATEDGRTQLSKTIRGHIQVAAGMAESMDHELLDQLLKQRRILVIVDGFSEMISVARKTIQPVDPAFPVHALIVTSRHREQLSNVPRLEIKPLAVRGTRLLSFLEAFFLRSGHQPIFEHDAEVYSGCQQFAQMVGNRQTTVLLAKLFAEQMIASKENGGILGQLPRTIPDLMLSYLNSLNERVQERDLENRAVHLAAQAVAWACVRDSYRPTDALVSVATLAVVERGGSEDTLEYLESTLQIVRTVKPAHDRIRFLLDPLAEYLAALHLLDTYGDDSRMWRSFLQNADKIEGSPQTIREFLLAVLECCMSRPELAVPGFLVAELEERTLFSPEIAQSVEET